MVRSFLRQLPAQIFYPLLLRTSGGYVPEHARMDAGEVAGTIPANGDESQNVKPDYANGVHNQRSLFGLAFRPHNFVRGNQAR
jgi:hypothetical protein